MTRKLPIGVHLSKGGRFRAVISAGGKQYHLGTFRSVETAERTYLQARKMVDDLMSKTPKKVVEIPLAQITETKQLSLWMRLFNKLKGFRSGE